jgi:hypothetical protein
MADHRVQHGRRQQSAARVVEVDDLTTPRGVGPQGGDVQLKRFPTRASSAILISHE